MDRSYINCHMTMSVDGKVTGEFLTREEAIPATEEYYALHRKYRSAGYRGFICGRITMEGSFTGGWYPDLAEYRPIEGHDDWLPESPSDFYAIAFDPKGRLGWQSGIIRDSDPGYDQVQVLEVLTEQADPRYLGYLRAVNIPYLFAGKNRIDVPLVLKKLKRSIQADLLLLEGGSIINGSFLESGCIDELSLVVAPVIAGKSGKSLCDGAKFMGFRTMQMETLGNGIVCAHYLRI